MADGEQWQVVTVPLSGGQMDGKAGLEVAPPSTAAVVNGEFTKNGSIRKRRGAVLRENLAASTWHPTALMVHRKSARLRTSRGALTYRDTNVLQDLKAEQNPGPLPCDIEQRVGTRCGDVRSPVMGAVEAPSLSKTILRAWREDNGGQVWYSLEDQVTGATISGPQVISTSASSQLRPRVLASATSANYMVFWVEGTTIRGQRVTPTSGATVGATIDLTTTAGAGWDVFLDEDNLVQVAWWDTTNNTLNAKEWSTALIASGRSYTSAVYANVSEYYGVALGQVPASNIWIAASRLTSLDGDTRLTLAEVKQTNYTESSRVENDTNVAMFHDTTARERVGICYDGTAGMWVGISGLVRNSGASGTQFAGYTRIWNTVLSTTLPAGYADAPGHIMAAAPFLGSTKQASPWWPTLFSGYNRIGVASPDAPSLTAYGSLLAIHSVLVEDAEGGTQTIQTPMPVGRWGTDIASLPPGVISGGVIHHELDNHLGRPAQLADGRWAFQGLVFSEMFPTTRDLDGLDWVDIGIGSWRMGGDDVYVDPTPDPQRCMQATVWGLPLASGGMVAAHDGEQMHEATLQAPPEMPQKVSVDVSAAGSITFNGSLRWRACWRWTDSEGRIRRSGPSLPCFVETLNITNKQINVTLRFLRPPPTCIVGVNMTTLHLEVYQQNSLVDSLYYLAHVAEYGSSVSVVNHCWWNVAFAVPAAAGTPDQGDVLLYTDGGELANEALPATADLAVAGSRLWALSGEDDTRLWPSKLAQEEGNQTRGPEWSKTLSVRMPEPIRAIASVDDRLVAFGERGIYLVEGDGPDNNNQGVTFAVRVISSDFGIVTPRAVVSAPPGVFFQAPQGIYLLGRDLGLRYVGEGVETALALSEDTALQHIISALAVPDQGQVRFHLRDLGVTDVFSAGPATLVYDYLHDAWAQYSHGAGPCAIRNGVVERVQQDRNSIYGLYAETSDSYFHDAELLWPGAKPSAGYTLYVKTPHIRPEGRDAGHMSVLRAQFILDTPCDEYVEGITIEWTKDYGDNLASGSGNHAFGATVEGNRFIEVTPSGSGTSAGLKCCAIQFVFSEAIGADGFPPPAEQFAPPNVARLCLELALLPGLLQGLPSTVRK